MRNKLPRVLAVTLLLTLAAANAPLQDLSAAPSIGTSAAACVQGQAPAGVPTGISVSSSSSQIPSMIPGGAQNATHTQAAIFAWQEFIALNWTAKPQDGSLNSRGEPDTSLKFGENSDSQPLVWQTWRGKSEIFPGAGSATVTPNGYVDNPAEHYGFDAPPAYRYDPSKVGSGYTVNGVPLESGEVPPDVGQGPVPQAAFVNLDEDNEIEENVMFAGVASSTPFPGQQFLYLAKANRTEYTYVAGNKWWYHSKPGPSGPLSFLPQVPPQYQTTKYVQKMKSTPPPGSTDYVSFPVGTVEAKSAWRRLSAGEKASGRFHMATVRYYVAQQMGHSYGGKPGNPAYPAWREETWGMVALHIIHKTKEAPYFIYATFEQGDAILSAGGECVEYLDGQLTPGNEHTNPTEPLIQSTPATATTQQYLTATPPGPSTPAQRLYYKNLPAGVPGHPVPRGPISVNRRFHSIPSPVIAVNYAYQQALAQYASANNVPSPFHFYKLVNVQWKPLTKAPGQPYSGPTPASYYLNSIVVETDYNLQNFSGKLDNPGSTNGLITDYYNANNNNGQPNLIGTPANNVPYDGAYYNMGGCMGCHGNIAELGADFSFIFNSSSVLAPEFKLVYEQLTP